MRSKKWTIKKDGAEWNVKDPECNLRDEDCGCAFFYNYEDATGHVAMMLSDRNDEFQRSLGKR